MKQVVSFPFQLIQRKICHCFIKPSQQKLLRSAKRSSRCATVTSVEKGDKAVKLVKETNLHVQKVYFKLMFLLLIKLKETTKPPLPLQRENKKTQARSVQEQPATMHTAHYKNQLGCLTLECTFSAPG